MLTRIAAVLLGFPAPIRLEGAFYAALAAADRGDERGCARRLEDLAARGAIPDVSGGAALARILPPASTARWAAVLEAIDDAPGHAPVVLVLEAKAAAETGDLARALRACRALEGHATAGPVARGQARRAVLAAGGRADFLRSAAESAIVVLRSIRGIPKVPLIEVKMRTAVPPTTGPGR